MKAKMLKRVLTCALAFSLTAADVAPVFGTEMQPAQEAREQTEETDAGQPDENAEETGEAEEAVAGLQEEGSDTQEAKAAETGARAEGEEEPGQAEAPSLTQPSIRRENDSSYFYLDFTLSNADGCELTVTESGSGHVLYESGSYQPNRAVDSDDFDRGLTPGAKYRFTLKPFAYNEYGGKTYGVEKSAEWAAPVPSVTQPSIRASQYSSYVNFYLNYTLSNAEACELTVTMNQATVYSNRYYVSGSVVGSHNFNRGLVSGASYVFTLRPFTNLGGRAYGNPVSVSWTAPTVPAVTGLAVKEMTPSGFVFSHGALPENASAYYEYSDNAAFEDYSGCSDSLPYDNLEAGATYYVRAYARMYGMKGSYSNVITVKAPVAEVTGITTEIKDTAVTLSMRAGYGDYTGFEIYRKNGKKYQKLALTSDNVFADTGLEKNKTYKYKVRAAYYNANTKKTTYGEYAYKTVTTGKAAMNLKAEATAKTKIQLKWTKISGAAGYDVYRSAGYSSSSTFKSGEDYSFDKYELVKSLSKKKKSYTDKKLTSGESYSYTVKAYRLVKGKKQYFAEASASADTKFSFSRPIQIYKRAQNPKNGKMTIAWYRIPQAGGYLVERKDDKGRWVSQAKLKVSKTSYVLPASPAGKTVEYRVRAYKGNKYSDADTAAVTGHIAAVTGVKAVASADGVRISWKAVPGAAFYRVYRTTSSGADYNADTKTYEYDNGEVVYPTAFKAASATTTNYYYTLGSGAARLERDYEAEKRMRYHYPDDLDGERGTVIGTSVTDYSYTYHSYEGTGAAQKHHADLNGPQAGVKYYYYVRAYGVQRDVMETSYIKYITSSSYGYSKAASASYAGNIAKLKAPTLTAKAGKKSATLTIGKVANAGGYAVYRSEKKKGAYRLVGVTTMRKFKDGGLTAKKTYYYKVKAIRKSSIGTDVYSSFSKVKSAKAK